MFINTQRLQILYPNFAKQTIMFIQRVRSVGKYVSNYKYFQQISLFQIYIYIYLKIYLLTFRHQLRQSTLEKKN